MWNAKDKPKSNRTFADPLWGRIFIAVLAGLFVQLICYLLKLFFGYLRSGEILVIAIVAGSVSIGIVWVAAKNKVRYRVFAVALGLAVAIVTYTVGIRFYTPRIAKVWDFEDGTNQGWGIYHEDKGRVIQSSDIVVKSEKFAKGNWCLEVNNIDIPTTSTLGKPAVKKWPAIYYEGGLSKARVTALAYVPSSADFRFADAKLFLFAGGNWEWHDSGRGQYNEGVILQPGKWVELTWDLRPHGMRTWSSPWPWRDILGIQIYIESGTFTGPIYIDNVTIYK